MEEANNTVKLKNKADSPARIIYPIKLPIVLLNDEVFALYVSVTIKRNKEIIDKRIREVSFMSAENTGLKSADFL